MSRKRTTKKKRRTINKKAYKKKTSGVGLVIIIVVFMASFGYALYRLSTSRYTHQPPQLIFETYPSEGMEIEIKDIDRRIYDALLDLKIPAGDVTFKTVETKRNKWGLWSFSELEIIVPATLPQSKIKETFLRRVSERIQKKSLRFASRAKQELIFDVSANGHHTHRLVFIKPRKKGLLEALPVGAPKVAIIIDDLGYDKKIASKFIALDGVMSFSVLPHSPFQKSIAATIHQSGRDVLLHLPMEPMEYPEVDPGVGALLSTMTPDDLLNQLQKNIDSVPFAVGVNNHMGSRLTQDPARMRQIFTILKKRNLFFLDSLTSPQSCCQQSALLLKLKFAQRNVFLDHVQDQKAIRFQIKRLVGMARKHGKAIGIGHPFPATWEVLSEDLPNIKNQVELVRVSELIG